MRLAAWEHDVGSCLFTVDQSSVRRLLDIPGEYDLTAFLGFGYPDREVRGEIDREPHEELAFRGTFGREIDLEE